MKSYYRFVGALALFSLVACNSKQVDYLPFQESEDGYWGLIDRKGKVLFAEEFENYICGINEGVLLTTDDDGKYQFYTVEKKPKLISEGYKDAGVFNGGFAPIVMKDEWIKFINKKGEIVSELKEIDGLQVEWISGFHYGVAIYLLEDGSRGLIDTKGKVLTAPQKVGLDFCREQNMLSYGKVIDNEILIVEYADATLLLNYKDYIKANNSKALYQLDKEKHTASFYANSNLYCISTKRKHIIMDGKKEVLEITKDSKCFNIYDIKGKYLLYSNENGDKKGIMDMKGNVVIRPKYRFLTFMDEKTLLCSTNSEVFKLIDVKDNVISSNVDIHEDVYEGMVNFRFHEGIACLINEDEDFYFSDKKGDPIDNKTYHNIRETYECFVNSDFFNVNKFIRNYEITETGVAGIGFNTTTDEFIELDLGDYDYYDEDELLYKYYDEDEIEFYEYVNGLKMEFYATFTEPIVTRQQGYKDWNDECELERLIVGFELTGESKDRGDVIFDGLCNHMMGKCTSYQRNSDTNVSLFFSGDKEVRLINDKEDNIIAIVYFM